MDRGKGRDIVQLLEDGGLGPRGAVFSDFYS
jgi:hypothetical protein